MKAKEYRHAREVVLGWTHERMAEALGKVPRMSFRYANGDIEIPPSVEKAVRRLVRDKLTMSNKKFEQLVSEL